MGFGMRWKGLTGLGCLSQKLTAQNKLSRDVVIRLGKYCLPEEVLYVTRGWLSQKVIAVQA